MPFRMVDQVGPSDHVWLGWSPAPPTVKKHFFGNGATQCNVRRKCGICRAEKKRPNGSSCHGMVSGVGPRDRVLDGRHLANTDERLSAAAMSRSATRDAEARLVSKLLLANYHAITRKEASACHC